MSHICPDHTNVTAGTTHLQGTRTRKHHNRYTTEAVKSWMGLLITVDTSFINLSISSINPLVLRGQIQHIYFKKVI